MEPGSVRGGENKVTNPNEYRKTRTVRELIGELSKNDLDTNVMIALSGSENSESVNEWFEVLVEESDSSGLLLIGPGELLMG